MLTEPRLVDIYVMSCRWKTYSEFCPSHLLGTLDSETGLQIPICPLPFRLLLYIFCVCRERENRNQVSFDEKLCSIFEREELE